MLATRIDTLPNGRRIRVARLGTGPPCVLLHGYPENSQVWCELAPRLASCFEAIAFDWPGMGESDAWPGGATPRIQAERLETLLDAWKIERATLVAMDMGGQPALAFAATRPERTTRLVVMNSLVFGDEATSWEIRVLRRFGWNRLLLRRFPRLIFRRAERTFLPYGSRLPKDLRADMWGSFRRPEVRKFVSKMCAGFQGSLPKLPALYGQLMCPTLVLWAERDKHFPAIQARRLAAAVPGATLEIVPDAHHWMAWHRAEDVADRILAFAGATQPGGR